MQAGKDVYGEKPASYNMFEGRQMVAGGAQAQAHVPDRHRRAAACRTRCKAIELLQQGVIGKVYMAKGLCFKRRVSIGHTPVEPVPAGVNWDLFLGPAPMRPFTENRFAYNWHWFWDTGNGDIGNQGIHEMDIARWGLGVRRAEAVVSTRRQVRLRRRPGNPQHPDRHLRLRRQGADVRGARAAHRRRGQPHGNSQGFVGTLFFGENGYMSLDDAGYRIFLGEKREPGEHFQVGRGPDGTGLHMANFLKAVKSRNYKDLNGDVELGVDSVDLVHMANTSYRLGRKLQYDGAKHAFVNDAEANAMRTRHPYRAPYVSAREGIADRSWMTVWEMLDILEGRIARLGAERAQLASALAEAERQLQTMGKAARPKTARRKPAKKSRKRSAAKPAPQPTPAAAAVAFPPAAPSLGKRIALGKGLAQLRARRQHSPDPSDAPA